LRDDVGKLRDVLIPAGQGVQIPLGQIATIEVRRGPMAVKTENAFPVTTVFVDIEGRDVGSYVEDARAAVAAGIDLPTGYSLEWSGQWEAMQRVKQRLGLVLPITIGIIFLLLYLNFRRVPESLLVMLSVPFALIGGVWYLWLAGYNVSVAVWVGFIALAGVAAETGVVMLLYLDEAWKERRAAGRLQTETDLVAAVREGAVDRLRPKVMTVATVILGLAPILWSHGTGADVMKRIAAPMVGGMLTSTALTLVVIPALYLLWKRRSLPIAEAE
jgi:Cu(I)/Ag(I) efflux system membrane protein CusA/SilA